jgi:putative transposase
MTVLSTKDWRKGRKYLFNTQIRFIFLTKRRGKVLTEEMLARLEIIFQETCTQMKCQLLAFEGKDDYVNFLVSIHPALSISSLAGKLKEKSSRFLSKEFSLELKDKIAQNHFWASSYAAASHGDSLDNIKEFLERDFISK